MKRTNSVSFLLHCVIMICYWSRGCEIKVLLQNNGTISDSTVFSGLDNTLLWKHCWLFFFLALDCKRTRVSRLNESPLVSDLTPVKTACRWNPGPKSYRALQCMESYSSDNQVVPRLQSPNHRRPPHTN